MTAKPVTIAATTLALALQAAQAQSPLHIARQGSLEADGRVIDCATNDGGDPNSKRFPPGHVVVDNVYATTNIRSIRNRPTPSSSIPAAATPRGCTTRRPTGARAG
jgi:hypothetical protein